MHPDSAAVPVLAVQTYGPQFSLGTKIPLFHHASSHTRMALYALCSLMVLFDPYSEEGFLTPYCESVLSVGSGIEASF
ncbi:unnamed protein product [marine sediment metagenome]|uniref:Uncharacterized protein n=1 Tax=marine sediment metagenome TaxID=412755 RepID=X0XY51_9ZZZZ